MQIKNNIQKSFLAFVLLSMTILYSQTDSDRKQLKKLINKEQSQGLKKRFSEQSVFQKRLVDLYKSKGYPEFIQDEDTGSFSQLVGGTNYGTPLYLLTANNGVVTGLKASSIYTYDNNFQTGNGMYIGLWENGYPRPFHEMLRTATASRIVYDLATQNTTIYRHATHVSGTLIGNQYNPSSSSPDNTAVRGVAYESTIRAWDWLDVPTEMIQAAEEGLLVGNTSFGYNPIYLHEVEFGRYNTTSQSWDDVMCMAPYFQIVKSAGNTRDDNSTIVPQVVNKEGYDLLEGGGVSKNVLVIGSVDLSESELIAPLDILSIEVPYSNWGPTDDGRIKPDLVTHGHEVTSSIETMNNAYGLYSGTSMAAAGVTGGITLLQQYWNQKHGNMYGTPSYMWSSTVRAILIHSATEIGNLGPDYKNGWGVVNLERAADLIRSRGENVLIREETLLNEEPLVFNVAASGQEDLMITLAWTDPAGAVQDVSQNPNTYIDSSQASLVNDLDVRVVRLNAQGNQNELLDSNGENLLLPWKRIEATTSNISELSSDAVRGDNTRDNIEKIEIPVSYLPEEGGIYQIRISHKGELDLACNSLGQDYSIVVSGVSICKDDLVFFQHQDNVQTGTNGVHVRANTITASNIIEPSSNPSIDSDFVEYEAKEYIELVPQDDTGFTADYGSDFLAHINCSGDFVRKTYSSREQSDLLSNSSPDPNINVEEMGVFLYPNPVINDFINIQFNLSQKSRMEVTVYNVLGQRVMQIQEEKYYTSGVHKKVIDVSSLSTGTFLVKIETEDGSNVVKMIKK